MKLPTIREVSALIRSLKPYIHDDMVPDDPWDEEDLVPRMDVTIGADPETGKWSYQTGDNSYTGGAYHYQYWGVITITRRCNSRDMAREAIDQIAEQYIA